MTAAEFIAKWKPVDLTESSASQSHFNDLCELLGHPKPVDVDKTGESFCFERGVTKHGGGEGWADVWKKGFFGWEYKGRHKDLAAAYDQLLQYRADLENPPLLVVCDMDRIIIHTTFERAKEQVFVIPLAGLDAPRNLEILRAVFHDPDKLRPGAPSRAITEAAAAHLGELADIMGKRGLEPHAVAHYLIRLVFCMFAEDVDLLPRGLFAGIVDKGRADPARFSRMVAQLFGAMAHGGEFGAEVIKHFNGNLFADAAVLDLTRAEIERIAAAATLEWNAVDATIFGTLFTRGIDPQQRSQLGAQYTGRADIETLVEPVIMAPLRREWAAVRAQAEALLGIVGPLTVDAASRRVTSGETPLPLSQPTSSGGVGPVPDRAGSVAPTKKARDAAEKILTAFLDRLRRIRVLDVAGGSGNFLYVTLQKMLDLEKEVSDYLADHGFTPHFPQVSPDQLFLIEINPYAHSLAQVTVQIGYIQWLRVHGYGCPAEPILRRLDQNFLLADSLFTDWPAVDFIIGNPPFLGGKKLRNGDPKKPGSGLGDEYVDKLFAAWNASVPAEADLCCYWFEKARQHIAAGKAHRAGLLASQAIRGGANREVLKHIKESGDIFFAVSDRDWILDGATVHVSMVGFDNGADKERTLNGKPVATINANLTAATDITQARPLAANLNLAFMGTTKGGAFDIPESLALELLYKPHPHGRPNSDVLAPWVNGLDITKRQRWMWIIDFGVGMPEAEAAKYEAVFEYVRVNVKSERDKNARESYRRLWWQHVEARPKMRTALAPLTRFLTTMTVSKHRMFVWMTAPTQPDHQLFAFARSDDYFFGILQSRVHEVWARSQGTQVRERESGFRYTPTTCFETFPFPDVGRVPDAAHIAPGEGTGPTTASGADAPHVAAIAAAAQELNALRERWLNPPEWTREEILEFPASPNGPWARYLVPPSAINHPPSTISPPPSSVARYPRLVPRDTACAAQLAQRTLTKLYNARPTWLQNAHAQLDTAVLAAYGWPADIPDDDLLARLLKLNLERSAVAPGSASHKQPPAPLTSEDKN